MAIFAPLRSQLSDNRINSFTMNFIEELRWRNMLHQMSEGAEEHLSAGIRTGYIGFDPTAPSLTIGNFVQIMILKLFQLSGHRPVVLMGGATGRVGDPSGKAGLQPSVRDVHFDPPAGIFMQRINVGEMLNRGVTEYDQNLQWIVSS